RAGEPHAAEHVEILRAMASRNEIEIGVAEAGDDRLLVLEPLHQPLCQHGAVKHLRRSSLVVHDNSISLKQLVLSGWIAATQERRQDEYDRRPRRERLFDRPIKDE